jgi:electron transfer flavoprotein beta subunit
MKILVPTKRVPDTDQKIQLTPDGSGIDLSNLTYILNPFDAIAVEEALRIQEQQESVEVVAVGVGVADYESELRTALAMGADRAILVECTDELDPWNVSKILAEVTRRESPDLVLMGKQAVDHDANQTGQFLAAQLDWPQATFASQLTFIDNRLHVNRETDQGIETINIRLPAVVTADLRLNEPRYASLPSILKARKKEIQTIALAELNLTLQPRLKVLKMQPVLTERRCEMLSSIPELVKQISSSSGNPTE